ncbi:TonB-dependent receptor [Flavobacterium difficile]|uniref:TonB-dependent receptor n=1 Tax=Flavobacterium difficile TaxID=2709659 RepID=A0ABX0IB97_9FLAO|nr:TonB-dependent receptor [Flavobacterium difficile]NHM02695.1 TonB-dependent receptor [Flavobacterium difficile]
MKKYIYWFFLFVSAVGFSQVTKSAIAGTVKSTTGEVLPGAVVEIKHVPTGTKYFSTTDEKGNYSSNSVRPGGPYTIKVNYTGYNESVIEEVSAPLGSSIIVNIELQSTLNAIEEVKIVAVNAKDAYNKGKTGAGQQFSTREINSVPIIGSRSINSITKYNANAGSNGTFGGQDSRLNNFTIDGSVFNNGFGLGSDTQAGGRTGSTAISLDAIEQLQVNIAPFDVRQSGFTGSGINAVTRSGTNEVESSVYHSFRNDKKEYLGNRAGNIKITPSKFQEKIWGARIGAPIIKDKLFFFGNFETIDNTSPATTWTASGSPTPGAQVSETSYTDLVNVSNLLKNSFGYETGPFENFDAVRESKKFLARIDWNINDNHKLTVRYVHHDSGSDELISNSNSAGFGNRRTNVFSMSYKNSGYVIEDNTRSSVLEWDWKISEKWSNNFIAGYDKQLENRGLQGGGIFPTIDIKRGANNYISAGLDPFTPGNLLDYSTLHFTNNITGNFGKHTLLFGANFERFVSNNNFYPASNGVYIFDTLAAFEGAVAETVANGGAPATTAANLPSRFQYRYSALPGGAEPLQVLKSNKIDIYAQDEYNVSDFLKLTLGVRATAVSFRDTALENPAVTAMTFANGEKFNTGEMPDTQYLFEPRFGFNLDVNKNKKTILRGGTGVFTGRPPLVFLSNAIGNNGVLTGFIDVSGADLINGGYGFTANPGQYFTPSTPQLPSTFDLAFTDKDFKFPQSWKTNIALDQKLPFGFIGSLEGIYSKNINEVFYYNANLSDPVGTISNGGDNRPFYSGTDAGARVNNNVSNAIVLSNSNQGYFYSTTVKLEYPYKKGFWGSIAYTYSNAQDLLSAGSIAAGSWTGARSVLGNNNLDLSNSNNNTPHRIVGLLGYKLNYGKNYGGSTSVNIGYIGEQAGAFTYTYGSDINGDRVNGNDLLYIPNNVSELRFVDITQNVGGVNQVLYTAAEQAAAFDRYIEQDSYLRGKRGQYVDRNANELPMLHRLDLSVTQDFFLKISGKKQAFQFRADILNFTNLLNNDWGVSKRVTNSQILSVREAPSAANNYTPGLQMAIQTDDNGQRYLTRNTFSNNSSVFDVWQAQFTLRYTFGK